jgi:hypothetical protein|tara:strand:- start:216 stop:401 length:186 start_codon:yes stop_codon:yes gene_type:complete
MINATKEEENYYNSESEGKEFDKDFWEEYNSQSEETLINTCEETYGKENCHEETYKEETNS